VAPKLISLNLKSGLSLLALVFFFWAWSVFLPPAESSNCGTYEQLSDSPGQVAVMGRDNNCQEFFIMPTSNSKVLLENLQDAGSISAENSILTVAEDVFKLHSRPSSSRILYLDFDGITWSSNSFWNGAYGISPGKFSPGLNIDTNPLTFSTRERQLIYEVWENVSEDFAVFDVDVTTELPTGSRLTNFNLRGATALILSDTGVQQGCGCGGVAYVDSFGWAPTYGNSLRYPALNFHRFGNYFSPSYDIAEIISHEVGHNLGLAHDGQTLGTWGDWRDEYFTGQGTWTPIMGAGRGAGVSHWAKGGYPHARTTFSQHSVDDFVTMARHTPIITDEVGNNRNLAKLTDVKSLKTEINGLISSQTDIDFYRFEIGASQLGRWIFYANTGNAPNLDAEITLYEDSTVVATANPLNPLVQIWGPKATGMDATITFDITRAGTYYLSIDGVGQGTWTTNGYDDYSSIGRYRLEITAPRAMRLLDQTITFNPPTSLNSTQFPYTLSAVTNAPGLTVSVTSSTPIFCTVSEELVLTLVSAGRCNLTASQSGNDIYAAARSVSKSITLSKQSQTITFAPPSSLDLGDTEYILEGASSSGLDVQFESKTLSVCTISENLLRMLTFGNCKVRASSLGNANFESAEDFADISIQSKPILLRSPSFVSNGSPLIVGSFAHLVCAGFNKCNSQLGDWTGSPSSISTSVKYEICEGVVCEVLEVGSMISRTRLIDASEQNYCLKATISATNSIGTTERTFGGLCVAESVRRSSYGQLNYRNTPVSVGQTLVSSGISWASYNSGIQQSAIVLRCLFPVTNQEGIPVDCTEVGTLTFNNSLDSYVITPDDVGFYLTIAGKAIFGNITKIATVQSTGKVVAG